MKITTKLVIAAIDTDVIPVCGSDMGNRFYNTIEEIDAGNIEFDSITFKDLLAGLIESGALPSLPGVYSISDIPPRVVNRVYDHFIFRLSFHQI